MKGGGDFGPDTQRTALLALKVQAVGAALARHGWGLALPYSTVAAPEQRRMCAVLWA